MMNITALDPQFVKSQKDRMQHLQLQLEKIVTEMKNIQEFLNEFDRPKA
tara:strand:+ start:327 stop:473 length:147 start_codon:yes stop_codon:yes gene_type:complete